MHKYSSAAVPLLFRCCPAGSPPGFRCLLAPYSVQTKPSLDETLLRYRRYWIPLIPEASNPDSVDLANKADISQ